MLPENVAVIFIGLDKIDSCSFATGNCKNTTNNFIILDCLSEHENHRTNLPRVECNGVLQKSVYMCISAKV
jgi:hypothetical protein